MTDELYQKAFTVNEERIRCEKIRALVVTTEQELHESALGSILHSAKLDLQSAENDLNFAEMELRSAMSVEHTVTGEKQLGCGRMAERTEIIYPTDKAIAWAIQARQTGLLSIVKGKFNKVAKTLARRMEIWLPVGRSTSKRRSRRRLKKSLVGCWER